MHDLVDVDDGSAGDFLDLKYEEVYLKGYTGFTDAVRHLAVYFHFYNRERLHQVLGYRTPAAAYRAGS